jgi:hypothetical protein
MAYPSTRRLRSLQAATLALAMLAAGPVPGIAQAPAQEPQPERSTKPTPSVDGMPLYTSDGKSIGTVITMGLDENDEPVLVAEIGQPLGLGPTAIAVPIDMFVRKGSRIELTLTEAEVNAKLKP